MMYFLAQPCITMDFFYFIPKAIVYHLHNRFTIFHSRTIRAKTGGDMAVSWTKSTKAILPLINDVLTAGDERALEMPGLASLHTVFVREHNRLAKEMRTIRPSKMDVLYVD